MSPRRRGSVLTQMKRLTLFLTSWPVMALIVVGCAIFLVWPDEARLVIRSLLLSTFLMAYLG